jgi:hypothetical protein
MQAEQINAPVFDWYVPAKQSKQAPAPAAEN